MDETIYVIFKVQFDFALEVCFSICPSATKSCPISNLQTDQV